MPVEFIPDDQAARYGRFAADPTPEQLARYFFLNEADLALIAERRRDHNKLGFAVQLCTLRYLGTFLPNPIQVPQVAVRHVAGQLDLPPDVFMRYALREETRYTHRHSIIRCLGYQEFDGVQAFRLIRWIYAHLAVSAVRPIVLFDLATAHLIAQKVVLPGVSVLARLIARVRERYAARTFEGLSRRLSAEQRQSLELLLVLPEGKWQTPLEVLRTPPSRVGALSLTQALHRVEQIRVLGIGDLDLSDVPEARQAVLVRHAQTVRAQLIERLGEERRLATLLVFLQHLERTATDDVLDIFHGLMASLALRGETRRKRERLRSLKDLDQAALLLRDAVQVLLNSEGRDARQQVLAQVGEAAMREAVRVVDELARPEGETLPEALSGSYTTIRRFQRLLLQTITFTGTPSAKPLLEALEFLKRMDQSVRGKPGWSDAPRSVVPKSWERQVFPARGEFNHQAYTLCVLERLHQALKRREVFVVRSARYGDPRAELLQGEAWLDARADVCRALERELDPAPELSRLKLELDHAYHEVGRHLDTNDALWLTQEAGQTRVHLAAPDALAEPPSPKVLRAEVSARLPVIDLAELLMEVHAFTGLADAFVHVADGQARVSNLPLGVCAALLSQACNIGLKAVARPEIQALTLSRLSWIGQNYVRADTLTAANARLVDAQRELPLAQAWGGGEVASADGLRFVVPVRSIHAGWNSKYFGAQRGVTYYNFTSDQFTGFHGIVIPGTLRDSLYLLAGLLEQQTRLDPREIMTDTHDSSDVVFGLFALLGYTFSPRLADLPDQRFWRLDREADYGALSDLSRHTLDGRLIAAHWEDMLRLAGSLKLGKVGATGVMRTLQRGGSLSGLGRAIAEFGRARKTLYLLHYVHDEAYRQRILRQLNRGEQRHSVARAVFYGQKGELRQKYREGMEDQLGALGLVVNAIVLWNTRYMGVVLDELRSTGHPVLEADVARLTPLLHDHIHMLGKYDFTLPEAVARGQLRPLRNPASLEDSLGQIP
ncbi:Tn3 family transposase [Deinococcus arenicola]|uniref:Tn3 family transposase n=1 Tax=Deinococcus arenicola TaxID=2994950 RepID=A0ABU4DVX9_9DEIO|nr:Tn3 family transposase [Deinococcus sp. ZS9-10]MDV6376184.1 Tn3 family transposase [Deinococcus sp. ZS9-10]